MKKLLLAICLAITVLTVSAQKLVDVYKKGIVKLIPDPEYAKGNNWDIVFKTYYDTINNTQVNKRKSLKIMPDGSVIISNTNGKFYTKFSPDGKFEKEFGILTSKGKPYKKINDIEGVINNNTFFSGLDNMGNIVCFDFNGNYKKTLHLNYLAHQMIALPNKKIGVVGWTIYNDKYRVFVSIVDYETNEYKIIWDYFTGSTNKSKERKLFNYTYELKSGGRVGCTTMPLSDSNGMSSTPIIACIGNNLIVGVPTTGEIMEYDLEGKLISKDKIEWTKNYITPEEQKVIQKNAIEKYRNLLSGNSWSRSDDQKAALKYMIKEMEFDLTKISEPILIPAFSTLIQDSDGNLLLFEYPKDENANKFNVWVYEDGCIFLCQSSFVCDEFDLKINPSRMVFSNGYIYSLQLAKNVSGIPLRLVRFKVR